MNGTLIKIKGYAMGILRWSSILLFAISLAIFITLNLTWFMIWFGHGTLSGISHTQIMADYGRLLRYLQIATIQHLNFSYIPMSSSGRQHFIDVKGLFMANEAVGIISGGFCYLILAKMKRKQQLWQLMLPIKGFGIFLPMMGLLLLVNFNDLFIRFHEVVFHNQDWIFDPTTDPIINVLTETFFSSCVILFVIIFELELAGLYYSGYRQLHAR